MNDKNTPGPWVVRVRRGVVEPNKPPEIVDCFVQAPDVHGYVYAAEVLGDDEYREVDGVQRKLADCQLIAAAPAMREALRRISRAYPFTGDTAGDWARAALAELIRAPV